MTDTADYNYRINLLGERVRVLEDIVKGSETMGMPSVIKRFERMEQMISWLLSLTLINGLVTAILILVLLLVK